MGNKPRVIMVLDCNGQFLSYCTRDRARNIVRERKGFFIADRTLKLKSSKSQEASLKREVFKNSKGICYICNTKIPSSEKPTIDHVIPRSRDKNAKNKFNMKCCCERCNSDKADRTLSEYVIYIKENRDKYPYISDKRLNYLEQYAIQFEKDYYNFYPKYLKETGGMD